MRQRRHIVPGAEYHVVARANRQEFIFESFQTKELMLSVLKEAKEKFKFELRNFCIMSNHVHFMIRPKHAESLSKIMQWILSVFAIRFNKKLQIHGHVWYDRFKSKAISSIKQLLRTFSYLTDNPVKAGLVRSPLDYRYCGVWFMRVKSYELIEPPDELIRFGLPFLMNIPALESNI